MRRIRYKLKLCPCCGERAETKSEYYWWDGGELVYRVKCKGCGLQTDRYKTAKFAADAWNRRANDEET